MARKHRCVTRWERAGYRGGPWAAIVEIGTLPDGRWYAWVVGQFADDLARLYPDEQAARGVAERWRQRIGGDWEEISCYPTDGWQPGGQPR